MTLRKLHLLLIHLSKTAVILYVWVQSNDFPTVYRWHKTWLLIFQQEYDHETPVLSSLHWLPVCFRIDLKVLLLHPLPPLPPRLLRVPLSSVCLIVGVKTGVLELEQRISSCTTSQSSSLLQILCSSPYTPAHRLCLCSLSRFLLSSELLSFCLLLLCLLESQSF